jgi:hypothetical protein
VHLIAQEIRNHRDRLTAEQTWWQNQPRSESRAEGFRRINFWREVLKIASQKLIADGDAATAAIAS